MAKTLRLHYLVLIFSLILVGCGSIVQTPTIESIPQLSSETPALLSTSLRTATPTFVPFPPEPTATLLFRAKRIGSQDYGQHLTLFIGDTFILDRLVGDASPLTIDNQDVFQATTNPSGSSITVKAVGIGQARVSSIITFPCPDAPVGCEPPQDFTYVNVTVIDH